MITSTRTRRLSDRRRVLGAAITVALCLGWVLSAAAAASVVRPPPVGVGLDQGIWVIEEDDDEAEIIPIVAGAGATRPVYRRSGGDLSPGRLRRGAVPEA